MMSKLFVLSLFTSLLQLGTCSPLATDAIQRRDSASYVSSLSQCPSLPARSTPATSVHDLRPDDFSYTLAVGDSITAGAFSHGIQSDVLLSFSEWRGDSYAGGGNPGSITVPNLIKHYNPSVSGGSIGSNPVVELCFGPLCPIGPVGWNSTVDRLNGALSGALAVNLLHEVKDYLVPQVNALNIPASSFKYLNLQIGSNDLCLLCAQSVVGVGLGSPDDFEANIRSTLEAIRAGIPNTVVNILGVLKVSDVYQLTLNQPYCSELLPIPHYNVECSCMLLGGLVGDVTRAAMDALQDEYNQRLIKIVTDYQTAHYSNFAVLWQPPNIPLSSYPVQALSNVDCFHPSLKTHQLVASQVWNLLAGNAAERDQTFTWMDPPTFRCLEADDRIQTSALL